MSVAMSGQRPLLLKRLELVAERLPNWGITMTTSGRFLMVVGIAVVTTAGLVNHGVGQQPNKKSDREQKPHEVEVVGKLVGTWGPSANDFKAMKAQWVISGTYVQIDKRFNDSDKVDTMTLLGWSKPKKAYCCWQFGRLDNGSPAQGVGAWDDESHSLTFTCTPNAEGSAIVIAYTVDGDSLTYKEGTKSKEGKVDWGLTCEWTKRHE